MRLPDDLGDAELEAVIMAVVRGGPATEEQIGRAANWANRTLIEAAMLVLVLEGKVAMHVPESGDDFTYEAVPA